MPRRAFAFASALVVSALIAAGVASCTTETTAPTTVEGCSTNPPSLTIVSPAKPSCNDAGECVPACVEVSSGADAFIPVVVNTTNFLIRPPGSCNGCVNCGHLVLRVNDLDNNSSTSSIVDVVFLGKIANHFTDLKLTVELADDNGNQWLPSADAGADASADGGDAGAATAVGEPITATVTITTKASCQGGTGGSGAASSSASSSSGTGGAGGGGGADAGDGG